MPIAFDYIQIGQIAFIIYQRFGVHKLCNYELHGEFSCYKNKLNKWIKKIQENKRWQRGVENDITQG